MGFGRGVPLWALTFMICSIQQKVSGAESSETVTIIPPLTTTPVISSFNPAHNGRVCSTWGNFYYKTFDGDIYHFPGVCNYVFASHCNAPFEDFNIQIRHTSGENATHEIKTVSMNIAGMNIEMETDGISVNNERVQVPYSESGCSIERVGNYVIVHVKEGLYLMWNEKDSLMLELDEKYANQTCGLCGDFNGIQTYNEFLSNNAKITPLQFGNMQKMNGPTEDCADPTSSSLINCANVSTVCREILTGPAFSDCNNLVGVDEYIESCEQDLCFCDENTRFSCLCATFAEYSRQCAHAGGHPQSWRTSDLCPKTCPFNMQYQECGSPCADACTNSERSQLCEDHCLDGCFCPAGTVYDDINNSGCISMQECSCVYNGQTYAPGTTYSDHCRSCYCSGGQWSCTEMPCPGICSVEGGSHISTYDEKRYDVHGDCTYVLSKICDEETFTVLGELRKCGLTDTETCLKMVALSINGGLTTIVVKPGGAVFVNWIYTQLPISAANVTIFRPSSFFIIVQTNYGLQLEIQLTPIMQLFVRLDPSFKGKTCGLCGNFDSRQTDDFKAISGVVEGTAPAFANTWKTQAICPNIKQNFEDPCSLSIENEKYAHHWCGLLTDAEGPFAKCHPSLNPAIYHKNCMFDTCNCERSEDCMCASLSAYVRACAAKGVELPGWRTNVCSKYMTSCPKSLAYSYTISSCQPTCRSLSEPDITCNIKFVPVDGCTCINGTYMDDYGKCVPASSCPCYYRGTAILPGEVLHDTGVVCTCAQGKMNCIGDGNLTPVCTAPMVYFDCKNATTGSTGAECQKSCQTLDMQCYSTQCMSGCMCPSGLVSDGKGNCIAMEECPCIHNDATYNPGEKIKVDCNTCVCQNRMWKCTQNKCLGTCAVYGDGHFITFDDKRYNFNGKCEYTLIQDHCGQNSSNQGTFRIMTENIPCGSTGTTCSKSIKVFFENYELILSEEHSKVVTRGDGNGELPYRIRSMGIYLVIETVNGVILLWDKKTSIFIKISPDFKGQVCGLCGNYDGNGINDFTTRSQSVVGDVLEFGNSWKVSPTCPDAKCIKDPCSKNPYRKSWSQKQCSIITSQVFAACHSQVEPTKYYEACVTDACACDSGGDCECFCTAVAAYAQACSEFGVCISWRTPSICPMFCDYYNAERECDWHYKACGAPCMKTCRNPSGRCLHQLPGLEGCYPYCPADKPYFNEEEMKCVDQCGCYDAEDNYYPLGTHIDLRDTCQSCTCTSEGIMCNYDGQACYCHYEGKEYIYKQVIYNTTDGLGWCMTATCDVNGTIYRDAYKCVGLTTTEPPFTFTTIPSTSGAEPTTPATTACVHKVCEWSEWYDVSYPTFGENNGDYETPDDIRAKGHNLCKFPDEVECRAERFPNIKPEYLNQNIQCTKKGGLICNNKDQTPPMCYNYQIKFLCCIYTPCEMTSPTPIITSHGGTTPTAPHSTTSLVSESTICQPECSWTAWFDVSDPTSTKNTGDIETMEEIRKAGNQVCDSPQYIECRAEDYPDVDIALLGQTVQCDPKVGLLCRNADQKGKLTECLNYQVRFHCCDYSHCRPGTTPGATMTATSTKFATSTPGTTPGLTSSPPSSSMGSTPPPTLWTTTLGTTVVATSPGKETTTTLSTPLSTIQVTTPGFVSTPSVSSAGVSTSTATSLQSTPVSKPTGSVPTESTSPQVTTTSVITTTTLPPSGSTSPSATSTICQPECSWTAWMDVSQPESVPSSGDVETIEAIREAGKHVCDSPQYIECRAEDYPDVDIALLGQTVQCNPKVGLLCRNADQKGKLPMCLNYQARFHCCDYSRCRPGTTPGTTTTATSTKHATSPPGTTPGLTSSPPSSSTASTPPPILWTTTQGTTVVATSPGKETTTTLSTPLSTIQVTTPGSVSTPSLSSAGVSTSTATSLQSTPVSKPTGSVPTESTSPQVTTTSVITTTTLPASGSTSPSATSTICQPECSWTAWMDVSQPESAPSSGDVETIEAIQEAGKHVCDSPQYIECRAEDYPDVDIALLGQTVQCDPKVGLLCRNADQKGKLPMCLNYQARFHCCDYSRCRPGTTPGATTTATSTKHATSTPGTTPGLTSSPPSSSTASTPPPILWTTTRGTTVLATSPGKESTTTLSTPLSTIQVTTPGSVSTPSVSSAGVSTSTATSLQSTPVSKPTGSVPTESTSPQVTTTSVITTTTLPPSGSTSPSATSTICQPECSWTAWMDVSQPESAPSSGDVETIEAIREAGKHVCDSPQYIECRAEDYPDVDIALLGQTVQCDPKVGLLCRNADQKGKLPMCLNYQARFHCCDYSRCRPGTTPGATTTATSTKHATRAPGTTPGLTSSPPSSSTASTPPPILWTTTRGTTVVATSPGKETTTTLSTPLSTIQVTTLGSVSTPSVSSAGVSTSTATSLQSTPVSKPTGSVPTESTSPQVTTTSIITTTTLPPSGSTSPSATSTICQPECSWTAWMDVSQPESTPSSGDVETIEAIREAGKHVCDSPQYIECRAEDYPDVDIALLGQTVQCDPKVGLLCRNADQKGKLPMCLNYQARFHCCDYSRCRPGTTPGATTTATSTKHATSTPGTTPGLTSSPPSSSTASTPPPILWTTTQGTTVLATSPGKETTTTLSTPLSTIQVTTPGSVSTPSVSSAGVSTSTATSLQSTPISKPTGSVPTESTSPQVTTTSVITTTTLPPSGSTSPSATSTICQPECSWTAWMDVSQPESAPSSGDVETIEAIREAGKHVCDSPQYIECRAEDYPDVDIALLGQTVQCDPKVGLLCRNADQKGKLPMCLNYQARFHCCDYSRCRPGTTPGATTTATSTKHATSTLGTTPGLTSSPPSSSTASTPPPILWTTTQGTTVVATSPGKETTTTLSTPLSTIQVTTPGSVSTPSVSSAGVSTSTATSLQSTPVSKPTGSVPTESTSPQVTTTSVITTTTLPPSGSTSPSATSTICQPECSWTAWMDVSQPESAPSSGDVETIEAIREAGKHVCDSPQYIECRAEDYPDVDIALLGQTVQCDPKVGLLCRNADQKGKLPMCLNYQARFHCCDYSRCRPGTTPGATTTATSTKHATSTPGTTPGLTSSPPSSSTASTPPPILWTTTQGTTVLATSPGKETTTTLSTPLSTIQVTTPGSVSTPSVSSAGVSTSTATSLQSTPVSKPTGSVPTESTSPQVTTTSVITTTTLPPSGSTSPSATSTICQPECSWTAWMDVSQPESAPSSGDVETIEAIREAGKHVCDSPQYIECRAEDYPDVDIALLGQTVQCDPKVGLLCRNADQKGKLPMCLNYQARFHCCDYSRCRPGTTPGATTTATSTKHATSTPGTTPGLTSSPPSSSTASTPPPILWTTTQGTTVLATSPGKETTTTLSTPLSTIQVTIPGSVSTPSVSSAGVSTSTATSLQSTPVSKPTGSVPTESTSPQVTTTSVITTTTLPASGSTSPSATSTICQPECSWTAWMDVSQPESAPSSGDVETIEAIREAGKHVCDSPQYIECRAEDYPDVDIALLGQTVQCDPKVGLLCRNADQKGKLPMCLNYQARFHCCDYSRCRPGTTPGATTTATSTKHATSTLGTTPGLTSSPPSSSTASTPPPILWTTTQGTTVVATSPGKETTTTLSTPLSTIQVTTPGSVSTPSVSSAGVSTSTATSLQSTPVSKPTGSVPTESTSPQVTTTSVITTTTLPPSGSTSPSATSTICQPECSWTAWMDVSQPESAPSSGDVETIEAIREAGKHVCDSPQYIECRAEDYPDVDIALLGQTVQCDPKVGLLCRNADQKGKLPMCLNYQARFHCCDYSRCRPGTTPGATTTATSTKHATRTPGTTPGLTSSPPSSSTASTPPPILWTTTQGTTVLATSPGKETTTTLSTPLSTIQVTTPGSVSTPSVSSAGVSTSTATSLQSTPVSKPTGSVPTESTSPQVTTTSVITTTTLPPSGSTSPSATSTICQPECSWTAWMDVSQPESAPSSGDVETIEAIREAGKHVCDSPQYIECRAEDYPDVDIALLGQTVQCDPKVGLLCRNADQKGKLPMCLNYQARFHCCDYSRCRPGTTPGATTTATSTKHATSTPGTTPGLTSSPPSSSTASTPPPILWTTTRGTTVLATSPGKESTTTLSTPLSTIQVTTPGSVSTPSVSSAGVSTSTATSLQSTPVSKPTGSVPTESTSPQVTTTSVITTTTLPASGSTSPSATSTICQPECSWTAWMDVSQPESAPSSGDVETIEAIREAGKHVCDSPQYIECRAEDYPDVDIALLGQTVQCDPKVGLLCRNADQKGKLPMCLNYQARFHCCDYSRCRPGTTPGATTTATSTKHATSTPGTTPGLTSSPPSSSTASTPPPILWTTTRGTTVVATSPGKETTTTLSTPLSTIQVTTPGSVSTPSVSSAGVSTSTATTLQSTPVSKPTGSVPTESTSPQVTTTSVVTTTTLPPSSSTSPLVSEPTSTKHATSTPGTTPGLTSSPPSSSTGSTPPPTLWTTTQGTTVVATSPGKETTTTLSTPLSTTHVTTPGSISTPSVSSATVSSSPATSLQSTSVSKPTGSVPTKRTTLEVSSTPFGQHTSPLPLVSTSVGVTETSPSLSSAYTSIASTTKIATTSSTGHISVTSSGVTPCFCHVSGVSGGLFSPGEVIYNRTDSSGCSFYAICDKNCEVKRSQGPCSSTTPSHPTTPSVTTVGMSSLPSASTPTILIPSTVIRTSSAPSTAPVIIPTTPVQGCPNADPPRKTNETWMYNNCSVATCEGNNRIVVVLPPPVEKITCENKLPPVKIDHDDGCTYHYDCACVCSGWDNSHFETFDGTSYIFHDNCTYILVQEIVNKYGNFSVLVDNYFCDPANNQSCSRSIIVNYNHMEVILSSQIYDGIRTNKVIFNKETIRTSFSKDGIIVADSGTSMSVEIPDIHAFINFNGFTFSIQVPFDLFAFNTEGQCGTCSNDRSDDCRLPSGHEASSCSEMAPHWKVNDSCKIVIPTPEPTGATTTPSEVTCATPSPLCELIVSDIFSDCHKVLPPKVFYDRCLSEACQNASGALTCYSVEMYASLCKDKGFCSDWRSKTQGKCPYHCPEGKVYEACGPVYPATCDKGKANITEHVTEGCFCPENQILVNSYTDTCVQDCKFCIGPEGFPKMPGTTWRSNCQECICDQLSVTVQCTAQPCSTPSTPPCEKEGFMPVSVLTPEDPCCPEIQCICNASACSNRKRSCEAGYQLTSVLFEGDCCVSFLCEPIPDICVVNETVYSPGGSIPSDSCETCVCSHETDPGSKRNLVECEPIQCDTECSVGYEYQVTAGECCGKCVQVTCTININGTTQVLKPGDIWQPESNNCSHYECEKEDDQLILVSSRRTCPIIDPNECGDNETEMTPDGCCKMCKPKTNCKVQTNQILVRQNDCVSSELVELTYCEGACPSSSMYSAKARAMQHKCTCCQELKSHKKEVSLTCRDGTTINYDYIYVDECQCMTACIPEATTAD